MLELASFQYTVCTPLIAHHTPFVWIPTANCSLAMGSGSGSIRVSLYPLPQRARDRNGVVATSQVTTYLPAGRLTTGCGFKCCPGLDFAVPWCTSHRVRSRYSTSKTIRRQLVSSAVDTFHAWKRLTASPFINHSQDPCVLGTVTGSRGGKQHPRGAEMGEVAVG